MNRWSSSTYAQPILQYTGDHGFTRAVIKYAELQSAHTDVYFYQFSYVGKLAGKHISIPGKVLIYKPVKCNFSIFSIKHWNNF